MEEPLIPHKQVTHPSLSRRLILIYKLLFALVELVPGVGVAVYVGLYTEIDQEVKSWMWSCAVVLMFAGGMQFVEVGLHLVGARKAGLLWAGLGTQWVNTLMPVPITVLLVHSMQLPVTDTCNHGVFVSLLVLLGLVMMLDLLCEWKKTCLICISCCGICTTRSAASNNP